MSGITAIAGVSPTRRVGGYPAVAGATTVSAGTKGFLFCDLRGYTAFIEQRGDQAAAELLATYRELVREVIAAKEGAEIRTEGDSVYVVFPAASGAVEAGLGIVAGAAERLPPGSARSRSGSGSTPGRPWPPPRAWSGARSTSPPGCAPRPRPARSSSPTR